MVLCCRPNGWVRPSPSWPASFPSPAGLAPRSAAPWRCCAQGARMMTAACPLLFNCYKSMAASVLELPREKTRTAQLLPATPARPRQLCTLCASGGRCKSCRIAFWVVIQLTPKARQQRKMTVSRLQRRPRRCAKRPWALRQRENSQQWPLQVSWPPTGESLQIRRPGRASPRRPGTWPTRPSRRRCCRMPQGTAQVPCNGLSHLGSQCRTTCCRPCCCLGSSSSGRSIAAAVAGT
mmetsp:Transcript_76491/g.138018  ORF Transcript_76491/g.138018 Transcript_76491/m.138018 type:complete len:236 (-) Transcript_76491:730-1437(-)